MFLKTFDCRDDVLGLTYALLGGCEASNILSSAGRTACLNGSDRKRPAAVTMESSCCCRTASTALTDSAARFGSPNISNSCVRRTLVSISRLAADLNVLACVSRARMFSQRATRHDDHVSCKITALTKAALTAAPIVMKRSVHEWKNQETQHPTTRIA